MTYLYGGGDPPCDPWGGPGSWRGKGRCEEAMAGLTGFLLGLALRRPGQTVVVTTGGSGGGGGTLTGSFDRLQGGAFAPGAGATWYWGLATASLNLVTPGASVANTCPLPILFPCTATLRARFSAQTGGCTVSLVEYSSGAVFGAFAMGAGVLDGTSAPFSLPAGDYAFRFTGPDCTDPRFSLSLTAP